MTFRKALFRAHLAAGVLAGGVILTMAVTGAFLAFEPQIAAWAERDVRTAPAPAPGAVRLPLEALAASARSEASKGRLTGVTVSADPRASVAASFGREGGVLYVDPYSGRVLGGESRTHAFLHAVEELHRWLGSREIGKPITGAACLAFAFLLVSGLFLWWPRKRGRAAFRAAAVPALRLRGRARDWNWHRAFGFLASPLILLVTLTGLVVAYPWASDLLYRLTGDEPPPRQERGARVAGGVAMPGREIATLPDSRAAKAASEAIRSREAGEEVARPTQASLDTLFARAAALEPGWVTLSLRLPQKRGAPVTASLVTATTGWRKYARSQASLDPATGVVRKWEPYAGQNLGRRLRGLVVPVHTGRVLGIPGQVLALLSACATALLVYTGMALAFRRLLRRSLPVAAYAPSFRSPPPEEARAVRPSPTSTSRG